MIPVNLFSILDPDISECPTSLLNTPSRHDVLAEGPQHDHCQTFHSEPCPNSATVPEKINAVFEAAPSGNGYFDSMPPGFSSGKFSSETGPIVKMPGSLSTYSNSDTDDTFNSGFYLDNIRIPSPLLYHGSSAVSGCEINTGDTSDLPDFELAHGQPMPQPDFVTYRNVTQDTILPGAETPLPGGSSPPLAMDPWVFVTRPRRQSSPLLVSFPCA